MAQVRTETVAAPLPDGQFTRRRGGVSAFYEGAIRAFCFACAAVSVVTTFGILFVLIKESLVFFREVPILEFFTGRDWSPTFADPKYGVLPLIAGSVLIVVGSAVIAIPLGLCAAVYLNAYASPLARRTLKPALEVLAGIPTVVYGFVGVFVVTPVLRHFIPSVGQFNAASGAIVVGVMILPLVSSLCEDALEAVPKNLAEAAYGLGATKFEVQTRVVIPAALSGIVASFILALSRAVGETMAVTLAAGATPKLTLNPAESIQTMTAYIVQISKGDVPAGSTAYHTLFAVGLTLFAATMVMNLFAVRLVRKFRQVYA